MFYAGAAALFAFGGISFDVARRLAARAHPRIGGDPDEYLYERAMSFTARVLEGDWSEEHEIEPERLAESVRRGQLWGRPRISPPRREAHAPGRLLRSRGVHRADRQDLDLFDYDLARRTTTT